jgi:Tfp pilus assembly protein PilF
MKLEDVRKHKLVSYAIQKMKEEDYHAANLAFSEAIKHNERNPVAHICRAFCRYELLVGRSSEEYQEQMREIVSDLEKALKLSKCNLLSNVD